MIFALLLANTPIVPAGQSFDCTPVAVWDGDGPIWCAEGPRIRLAGIAAREIDDTCRPGQPCPRVGGSGARDTLAALLGTPGGFGPYGHRLVNGPTMRCRSVGWGKGERTAAWCVSPISGDISCAMVRSGAALRWDRYWQNHRC